MFKNFRFKSLILVLFISVCSILTACSNNPKDYKVNIKENDIAYISLFAYSGKEESNYGLMNLGHSFLSIDNISSEDIVVYNFTIPAGETVTIGTWCIDKHYGVWFNIESNYIVNHNKYDGRYSITTGIGTEDIDIINEFIKDHDKWGVLRNCSYFALSLWNEIAEENESISKKPILTPAYLEEEIAKFENYEINRPIVTDSNCYYYDNDKFQKFHFEGDERYENI